MWCGTYSSGQWNLKLDDFVVVCHKMTRSVILFLKRILHLQLKFKLSRFTEQIRFFLLKKTVQKPYVFYSSWQWISEWCGYPAIVKTNNVYSYQNNCLYNCCPLWVSPVELHFHTDKQTSDTKWYLSKTFFCPLKNNVHTFKSVNLCC